MFGKTKMYKKNGLQMLLYLNFIVLNKYKVDTVAKNWPKKPLSKSTLYKWIEGERIVPHDQISNLVIASGDISYLEYYCKPCGYQLIPKIEDKKTADVVMQVGKIMLSATDKKGEGE